MMVQFRYCVLNVLKSIQSIYNTTVSIVHLVDGRVQGLCPLLPHQAFTHVPPLQPRNHVVFHNVHFRQDGGLWELLPVKSHEVGNILLCKKVNCKYQTATIVYVNAKLTQLIYGLVCDYSTVVATVALAKQGEGRPEPSGHFSGFC